MRPSLSISKRTTFCPSPPFLNGIFIPVLIDSLLSGLSGRRFMTAIHIICGVVAAGLLVYLFIALFKPEKF